MHVVAIHDISDPGRFWETVQQTDIPEGMTLHSVLPAEGGSRAVCLWEAGSRDDVRDLVDGAVGEVSSNEFYEVDPQNAQGLPG
jgi:hypothetical protein